MRICVYCSSSSAVAEEYKHTARELGELLGHNHHELVYGAGNVGLMGELASAAKEAGARITGVIPRRLADYGLAYALADEIIVTETMAERKQQMESRAEAFIALPGGIGTLEEVLEVMTLKQLGYMTKPLVLLNTAGFYDLLLAHLQHLVDESFMHAEFLQLYSLAHNAEEALQFISGYQAPDLPSKWF